MKSRESRVPSCESELRVLGSEVRGGRETRVKKLPEQQLDELRRILRGLINSLERMRAGSELETLDSGLKN